MRPSLHPEHHVIFEGRVGTTPLSITTLPAFQFQNLAWEIYTLYIANVGVTTLQFRTKDAEQMDVLSIGEWMQPITAADMNAEIMTLIAREMDPSRRDGRYLAPYCPLRTKNTRLGDDPNLLMDGAMPPERKRATRAASKARDNGTSKG